MGVGGQGPRHLTVPHPLLGESSHPRSGEWECAGVWCVADLQISGPSRFVSVWKLSQSLATHSTWWDSRRAGLEGWEREQRAGGGAPGRAEMKSVSSWLQFLLCPEACLLSFLSSWGALLGGL